ncbi:elongation factor P 5-aminopentanone reductase [Bacillus sp. CGMCC 1.16607]|uniref:elongation factor P 5-aminopentanone reductase n=1 Tax=Bacillus sp. CGMCC 1.16607 TaxID=3351842 RepID=UPI0036311EF5
MSKFVLITGASGGIGQAIAKKLAKEGYNLYLHYNQNEQKIVELLEELNEYEGEYIPIQADLSVSNGHRKITNQIFTLDAIIHNSGQSHHGMLMDLDEQVLERLMNVHVVSPLLLTKMLLPKLTIKRQGGIIVISSIWGQTGGAFEVAYSTVKGAQISFVKALSKELALNGIRVNAITPGAIETSMMADFDQDDLQRMKEEIPMGRLGNPNEVADGVSFLLSEQSSYITGQVLAINGGWYM